MNIPTVSLQIAAQDLRFLEVRAREEERIRAAEMGRAGQKRSARLGRQLLAALSREIFRHRPQVASQVAAPLETGAR